MNIIKPVEILQSIETKEKNGEQIVYKTIFVICDKTMRIIASCTNMQDAKDIVDCLNKETL